MMNKEMEKIVSESILGTIDETDKERMRLFLEDNPASKEELELIMNSEDFVEEYERYSNVDREKTLVALRHRLNMSEETKENRFRMMKWWKVAAMIIALIATGGAFWLKEYSKVVPPTISSEVELSMSKALETQHIGNAEYCDTDNVAGMTAYSAHVTEKYLEGFHLTPSLAEEMLQAENITTYRNKEHWLTLSDGTIVHLSKNTRIIYPEHFSRFGNREVVLEGEAYFMVAHDKSRKFIVHTPTSTITDYGTEFYVSTGKDAEVVLVNGKVGVTLTGSASETPLHPGERVSIAEIGKTQVSKVDVEQYKSWNTGKYEFYDKTLEEIMDVMERWYEVEVTYEASINKGDIRLMGSLNRHGDIESTLRAIEISANVKMEYSGGKIIVKTK